MYVATITDPEGSTKLVFMRETIEEIVHFVNYRLIYFLHDELWKVKEDENVNNIPVGACISWLEENKVGEFAVNYCGWFRITIEETNYSINETVMV